jgi:putative redox protein
MQDEWKEIIAEWKGESIFIGKNQAGGTVQMGTIDGKPGVGPMEMLLVALAGCTGMDIVSILNKKRVKLDNFEVSVRGRRAEDYPKIWTEIEVIYRLWGENIDPKAVEQAIQLSEEKYCSVGIMLGARAEIRSNYVIN